MARKCRFHSILQVLYLHVHVNRVSEYHGNYTVTECTFNFQTLFEMVFNTMYFMAQIK